MDEQVESVKPLIANIIVAIRKENNVGEICEQYPNEIGEDEKILAKYMIPKGELKSTDFTIFYLGRKQLITKAPELDMRRRRTTVAKDEHDPDNQMKTIEILAYTFSEDSEVGGWEMLGSDLLVAYLSAHRIDIIDDSDQSELAVIEPHFELQYTEMEPLFVAVALADGSALGLRFKTLDDEEQFMLVLEAMCTTIASTNGLNREEIQKKYTGPTLFCFSAIKGDLSIAFCCSSPYVEFLRPILELSIEEYTKASKASTLKYIFDTINKTKYVGVKSISIDIFEKKFELTIPSLNTRDQISTYSIRHLLSIFKQGIMDIFNFVLLDKKVIFLGQRCAAQDICNCVIAAGMIVAPLIVAETRSFPFTSLTSKFFRQDSFIAGLDDPNIIQQTENWDLLCNIDNGTVTFSPNSNIKKESSDYQATSAIDSQFYEMIYKLHRMNSPDSQMQIKFRNYTRRILDMATNIAYFPNDQIKESEEKLQRYRVGLWAATSLATAYTASLDSRAIKQKEIYLALQRLAMSVTDINEKDLVGIFNLLQPYTNSQEKIDELSTAIKDYGCSEILGMALLHPSENVKKAAKTFLYNMKLFQNNSILNPFFRSTYRRYNSSSNR